MKTIRENSKFRVGWDLIILVLVIASCLLIPFQIALQHVTDWSGTEIVYLIDLFFLIDIGLNFLTSYRHKGTEIANRKKTSAHYLKTFFVIDLLAYISNFPPDCWVMIMGIQDATAVTRYIRALYWTIVTMTTVGYGDITPHRDIEYIFTMVVMLMGASGYAFIIGKIASLFSNIDAAKATFWNRIEAVNQYLRSRNVPHSLNEQVRNYYEYLWAHHRGVREDTLFDDLPTPFRLDILRYVTRELLEKCRCLNTVHPH